MWLRIIFLYLHRHDRSPNLLCLDPFLPTSLYLRREKKSLLPELETNPGHLASQTTTLTAKPWLSRLSLLVDNKMNWVVGPKSGSSFGSCQRKNLMLCRKKGWTNVSLSSQEKIDRYSARARFLRSHIYFTCRCCNISEFLPYLIYITMKKSGNFLRVY